MYLPPLTLLNLAAIVLLVALASAYDLAARRIPNFLTVSATLFGFAAGCAAAGLGGLLDALCGFALGFALLLPGFLLGFTGGGDVKLLAAIGALTGPSEVIRIFVIAVLAGASLVLLWAVTSCLRRRSLSPITRYRETMRMWLATGRFSYTPPQEGEAAAARIPLAPALAFGTVATVFNVFNFT